jgi:hypothetical protein
MKLKIKTRIKNWKINLIRQKFKNIHNQNKNNKNKIYKFIIIKKINKFIINNTYSNNLINKIANLM